MRPASIFVAVLGRIQLHFCLRHRRPDASRLAKCTGTRADLDRGVTALIVPDNPRALVTHANRYEPELNRTTAEFAAHYHTVILPASRRKPQDKAKVEVGVQVVERWI